jgi:hypothetical protein
MMYMLLAGFPWNHFFLGFLGIARGALGFALLSIGIFINFAILYCLSEFDEKPSSDDHENPEAVLKQSENT